MYRVLVIAIWFDRLSGSGALKARSQDLQVLARIERVQGHRSGFVVPALSNGIFAA